MNKFLISGPRNTQESLLGAVAPIGAVERLSPEIHVLETSLSQNEVMEVFRAQKLELGVSTYPCTGAGLRIRRSNIEPTN